MMNLAYLAVLISNSWKCLCNIIMMNLAHLTASDVVGQSLEIMWKGMLSIFVVIIILTVLVSLITKFVKDPKDKE